MSGERSSDHRGAATLSAPVDEQEQHAQSEPRRGRRSRIAFRVVAWLFAACVVVQVLFAGLAIFDTPARWGWHTTFAHFFELLPLILLVLAFTGRLPHRARWLSLGAFLLIAMQYAFISLGRELGIPALAALHPVNALLIFWVALLLARAARRHA